MSDPDGNHDTYIHLYETYDRDTAFLAEALRDMKGHPVMPRHEAQKRWDEFQAEVEIGAFLRGDSYTYQPLFRPPDNSSLDETGKE